VANPEVHFHDISMAYGKWLHEAVLSWTTRTCDTSTSEEVRIQQGADQEAIDGLIAALNTYRQAHVQPVYEPLHEEEEVA